MRALLVLLLLLSTAASAAAQSPVIPTQGQNTKNQQVTSASNAPVSVTLTAPAHTRAHLESWAARCSAGSAAVTITDGGTTIWSSSAALVGTTTVSAVWMPGLAGRLGQNMVITLGTCGSGNTGVLDVAGEVF
jgi:hypothetical protein